MGLPGGINICTDIEVSMATMSRSSLPQLFGKKLRIEQLMTCGICWIQQFKTINFKGAGGLMFKTRQFAPYNNSSNDIIIISKFEPHSRFHS